MDKKTQEQIQEQKNQNGSGQQSINKRKTDKQWLLWLSHSLSVSARQLLKPPCTERYARWCERTAVGISRNSWICSQNNCAPWTSGYRNWTGQRSYSRKLRRTCILFFRQSLRASKVVMRSPSCTVMLLSRTRTCALLYLFITTAASVGRRGRVWG